jgi:hypothetical protein
LSRNDPGALTPLVTDMGHAVNEIFEKEKGILVTNGWKINAVALQRYVNTFMVGIQFLTSVCFAPASRSALCKVSKFVVYSG